MKAPGLLTPEERRRAHAAYERGERTPDVIAGEREYQRLRERPKIQRATQARARRTHCKNGHEFTEENTRYDRNGWRECRACGREREAARKARAVERRSTEGWVPGESGRPERLMDVLEDFDWLISCGESPEVAASRVGVALGTIATYRLRTARDHQEKEAS